MKNLTYDRSIQKHTEQHMPDNIKSTHWCGAHSRLPLLSGNYMACEMQLHFHANCLAINLVLYSYCEQWPLIVRMAYEDKALFATHSMYGFALDGLGTLLIMAEDTIRTFGLK